MRNIFILLTIAIFSISCDSVDKKQLAEITPIDSSITTYYLIRHAEKDRTDPNNSDPNLTEEGLERAKNWATFFKNLHLDQIYTTNYNRTQQTAMYVATNQKIAVQSYDPSNLYSDNFQKLTYGQTTLIVGHSNTTPQFVNAIIGEETYPDMDDSDNSSVYVVTVTDSNRKVQIFTVE